MPILLLDMDGVIADFNRHAIHMYNRYNRTNFDENLCNEIVGNHVVEDPRVDPKLYRRPFKEPGFFLNIPIIPGAQEAVARLTGSFDIYVVSTQYRGNPTCVHEKQMWLERFFPKIADHSIFTKHKSMVRGDILVDDRPENLKDWAAVHPGGVTASLKYKWTETDITDIVAEDWAQLTEALLAWDGRV